MPLEWIHELRETDAGQLSTHALGLAGCIACTAQLRNAGGAVVELHREHVPAVGVASCQTQSTLTVCANEYGRPTRPRPTREQLTVAHLVVASLEVSLASAKQRSEDDERFLKPTDSVSEVTAQRAMLELVVAGAEPEDQPAVPDLLDAVSYLGQQSWVPEACIHNPGAR